jgi:predicted alpha/beta-hydrolase family hydrolase
MKTFVVSGNWGQSPACDYGVDGPLLVLAHGAGAGQAHPFMTARAEALSARGVRVVTFDFPYMAAERRAPDRPPVLEACFVSVIAAALIRMGKGEAVVGGKSMGGRIASHLAARDTPGVRGLVVLGYPLQPPSGAPRIAHLAALRVPSLFVQGERDSFGSPADMAPHLPASARLLAVAGADHSFAVRKKDGRSAAEVAAQIDDAVAAFVLR